MRNRIPPGQKITDKFPVLTYGPIPAIDLNKWKLEIFGEVEREITLIWDEFMKLPQTVVVADFHCVTGWSRLNNRWEGVLFKDLMKLAIPGPDAKFVLIHCYGGYTTNLPLDALMDDDVILAHSHDGKQLTPEHGYPLRLIVPKRYAWKSAKWVHKIELMREDKPGFWERNGYNNNADPWKEERYW